MVKAETGRPTSAEDVHLAAQVWLVDGQPDEAAVGHTTGADVRLAGVVRANLGGGDAAAQTVCDAAHVWRSNTRLDRGPTPGASRRLLAAIVDHHQPSWRRRNLTRVAVAGIMCVERMGPAWARQLAAAVTVAIFAAWAVLAFAVRRAARR